MKKLLFIILLALPALGIAQKQKTLPSTYDLIIGTYNKGENKAIYVYRFYAETGKLAYLSQIEDVSNPSYLTASPDNKFVYAVTEDSPTGAVTAFKFDAGYGKLEKINSQPTGAGPAHIAIDKDQKNVFVSNYGSGSLAVVPINKDGSLGAPTQTIQSEGKSINAARQATPHVHSATFSPDEKFLFVADLGTDKINIYRYRASKVPALTAETPVSVKPGSGPRHMDFSADGKFLYVVNELTATVTAYSVDGAKLTEIQTVPITDENFKGKFSAADIHISPNGKFLYASNRGEVDEIVTYEISPVTGQLRFIERYRTMGKTPRNFIIDPTGKFLIVANQGSNTVNVLSIDQKSGRIFPTRNSIQVDSPACLKLVPVE
ncbi:MAG: lactonase family protein [Sphingobacteriaceae bacterium]|nr:MAG: lactonase family protein [Sphingobacteriaceae bacterium]